MLRSNTAVLLLVLWVVSWAISTSEATALKRVGIRRAAVYSVCGPRHTRAKERMQLTPGAGCFAPGRELANSFSELTDAVDQRRRLEAQITSHSAAAATAQVQPCHVTHVSGAIKLLHWCL